MTHARRRSRWFRYAVATTAASALAWGAVVPAAGAVGRDDAAVWAGNVANPYGGTDYFVDATAGVDTAAGTSRDSAWKAPRPSSPSWKAAPSTAATASCPIRAARKSAARSRTRSALRKQLRSQSSSLETNLGSIASAQSGKV